MMSETAMTIYYWGCYAWIIAGFLCIAIPAGKEFYKIFRNKGSEERSK